MLSLLDYRFLKFFSQDLILTYLYGNIPSAGYPTATGYNPKFKRRKKISDLNQLVNREGLFYHDDVIVFCN